ncbi:hypothetical protein, conserved [Eimeria brunetti]|uniref:Uncharacterized protein n=1 Tax=Eimeria brunetti TaxID=51314 RepID=U6LJI3_9EIME|nr:hypothetical protein, conserved [Eimeria brunetti]
MESLFNFLLQEDAPGESFDPRAARPRCKVCGADAWLQWDGNYADYCSRSCRDKHPGTQSCIPAPGHLHPSKRCEGGTRGPPDLLGERQAQLQQEKEDLWEGQFSPRNRYLPRRKALTQEQKPQKQRQTGRGIGAGAVGAFAGAAAAKKVARALRQRAPRTVLPRESAGPRMEGGPPSAATTPRRMPSIAPSGSDGRLPLQRQRTVARFVEQGENAAELQTALKEYQENLSRQRQTPEEEKTAAAASDGGRPRRSRTATTAEAADTGHLSRSGTDANTTAAAAAEATKDERQKVAETTIQLLQWERAKYEEKMKAIKEESEQQLQQHKAQLAAEVKRLAAKELDIHKALEKELGEVRDSFQKLKQQQEQHRQQQEQLLQRELEQHLRAQLQQDLEQRLERKLRQQLQEDLGQQLQQQLQLEQEQLKYPDGAERLEGKRPGEDLLRQRQLQQQLNQGQRLQKQLLEQQRQQEKLLYRVQQQEQMLQRLTAVGERRSSARKPQRPSRRGEEFPGEIPADRQLKDLLLQGLFGHLRAYESQQQQQQQKQHQEQQQPETPQASSWAERELALLDARAAAAAAASEAKGSPVLGLYEGQLEATVLEANLQLPDPTQQQQQQRGLRFGSKLQVVLRVATGPGAWEERETSFSADGQWRETYSFSVHWPSAAAAAASAALYAQLWATINGNSATMGHCSSSCCSFVGEAVIPLPTFTSPWEYRAPLRWRSSLGGNSKKQQLLQQGNLLLRVHFHPTEEAQAPVASTEELKDLPALLPTLRTKAGRLSNPQCCRDSNKGSSSRSSRSTHSSSCSRTSSGISGHSEEQMQPASLIHVSERDDTVQQHLLRQLEELSVAWRRALSEEQQQQKQREERTPVVIDGQLLQEHLQRSPMMGALCTNSFCSNMAGAFSDLYSEEEFRAWGICSSCQQRLFTTPLPPGRKGECPRRGSLQLRSPFAHCCGNSHLELGFIQALARAATHHKPLPFGELRLDGKIPVAFPTPDCVWPSALQLLHAQRFSLVSVQERLRRCSCSGELLVLLQAPLLRRFERPDWHSRAAAAVRTCLLLLLQQHPKLQLLLSSLEGRRICYHDPLQLRLLRRMQQQPPSGKGHPFIPKETEHENTVGASSLQHNFAGLLLMDLCAALGPPVYV